MSIPLISNDYAIRFSRTSTTLVAAVTVPGESDCEAPDTAGNVNCIRIESQSSTFPHEHDMRMV